MSTTHLLFDSGTLNLAAGPAHQIGPNLDVRKYSQIRFIAHDVIAGPEKTKFDLLVKEGSVELPLRVGIEWPGADPFDVVLDVPGRELQIWVHEFGGKARRLHILLFGLEL
jgi:hypothetical protein